MIKMHRRRLDSKNPSRPDVGASTKSKISDLPYIFALLLSVLVSYLIEHDLGVVQKR